MSTNGHGKLGSHVLPLGNEYGPMPTNEIGVPSITALGFLPGWVDLTSIDEMEQNPKLTFPSSISTYHQMRADPQVQGLLTGAIWPLLRMKWYINPNNAPDEMVEHIATDLNLPIIDPYAPPTIVQPTAPGQPPTTPPGSVDVKLNSRSPKPARWR